MDNNNKGEFLISICITSYMRIKELERCLKSVDSKYTDKVEIIVSEDKSPMREQIQTMVENFVKTSPYHVVFNTNAENLGYDRNLKKLIMLASGEYIFYMSDDDCLFPGALDKIIDFIIGADEKPMLIFEPFMLPPDEVRRKLDKSHYIKAGEASAARYIGCSILFSGLIFNRDAVKGLDAEKFKNLNYFQVYMFLTLMYKFGGYYLNELTVNSISDGENAYGHVESSDGNALLADRNSIFSDLEFNKGLFKVIRYFEEDNGANIFPVYSKEYSLRTFGGLCRAKAMGNKTYKEYWKMLKSIIKLEPIAYVYFIIIYIIGSKHSMRFFKWAKAKRLKIEGHVK